MVDIHKNLKQNKISPLYLLYGKETFLIDETLQKMLKILLAEEERDFNLSIFDMDEVPVDAALDDAETLPFIGEKRVVIIKNPIFMTGHKDKTKQEHDLKRLESYLENPSPDTVLIFQAPYEKLDERKKIVKLLKNKGELFEAVAVNERSADQWIETKSIELGVSITQDGKELLIQLIGTELSLLAKELDKMAVYVDHGGVIDRHVVTLLVSRSLEQNIFELVEKTVKRQRAEALRIYYDLLRQKEEPIKILALLASQFRMIYQVKLLSMKGYSQQQIASTLKVHPYRIKLAAGQAQGFTAEELVKIVDGLAEIDYRMKTGQGDKELLLELFIMKLK